MSINERFETIIKVLFNNNKRAFAKTVGVSPTVVENIVGTRKGNPSYEVLRKVCANANISAEWILFGTENQPVGDFINIRKDHTIVAPKEGEPEDGEHTITTVFTKGKATPKKAQNESPFLKELLDTIKEQAEEIGQLKEQVRQLTIEKERLASNAHLSDTANAG
jgi:transcriptional regulator with XRE-family HTH domain